MPQTNSTEKLRACVDSFVLDLTTIMHEATLESLQEVLESKVPARRSAAAPTKAAAPRTPSSRAGNGRRHGRRTPAMLATTMKEALTFVTEHPGCAISEIGKAFEMDTKDLRFPMANLIADGELRTTGAKRGTRYYLPKAAAPAKKAGGREKAKKR